MKQKNTASDVHSLEGFVALERGELGNRDGRQVRPDQAINKPNKSAAAAGIHWKKHRDAYSAQWCTSNATTFAPVLGFTRIFSHERHRCATLASRGLRRGDRPLHAAWPRVSE